MTREQASEIAFDFEFQESTSRTYLEFDWSRDFGDIRLDLIVPRGGFSLKNTAVFTLMLRHRLGDEMSLLKTDHPKTLATVLESLVAGFEKAAVASGHAT